MPRTNKVILIAGTRGTGKTDFAKSLVQINKFPKQLIVDTFDNPVWHNLETWDHPEWAKINIPAISPTELPRLKKGKARIYHYDTNSVMATIQKRIRNTFIIFEDATKYIGSRLSEDTRNFVIDSKQKNLDLVFIFHNLTAIPPELVRVSDILILFKTNEGKVSTSKYPWAEIPEMMQELRENSNRYANKTLLLN